MAVPLLVHFVEPQYGSIRLIFTATDSRNSFCLLTLSGRDRPVQAAEFVFEARSVEELSDPAKRFTLSPADLTLLNPNTRTCPVFRTARDAELTKAIYRRVPVLLKDGPPAENPWGVRFMAMLHMANDSGLFKTAADLQADGWRLDGNVFRKGEAEYVPLYEAKMLHQFDHRWATYDGTESREVTTAEKLALTFVAQPRYWVPASDVAGRLEDRWKYRWLLGWRDITRNTDTRTMIATILPATGTGDTVLLMFPSEADGPLAASLAACLDSFVLDYAARQKLGGTHLKYHVFKQLPVPTPGEYAKPCPWAPDQTFAEWLRPRVLELVYTASDLKAFAQDCGYGGDPFSWDEGRRFQVRCELDAAFFHLYGISEADASYILDAFPHVRSRDIEAHGTYRTKDTILRLYREYQAVPPAQPKVDIHRLSMVIVLLLQAAKQASTPASRDDLTLGVALVLNPAARRAVLGQPLSADEQSQLDDLPQYVSGLNEILVRQLTQGLIREHDGLLLPGSAAPPFNEAPRADRDLVQEVVRAVSGLTAADKSTWSTRVHANNSVRR